MTESREILVLIEELINDYRYITEAMQLRDRARQRVEAVQWNDELDLMVLGSCLHSIYNAYEAYFLRVAKHFENSIDESTWHRDLLDRMTLAIPETRPALITNPDTLEHLDELRRFRHLFRNLYKTRLRAPKLRIVDEAAAQAAALFPPQHEAFCAWLRQLAQQLRQQE